MVIKIDRGDGTFHLFPEVKDVIFSSPNEVTKCLQHETLPEYFDRVFSPPTPDRPGPRNISFYDVPVDRYPNERRQLFFGIRREVEQFCMRKLHFIQGDIEYSVITEYPVYLCQDNGKTIETIK